MNDRNELQDELEATREDLADTIDALGDRLDVKSRADDAAHDVKDTVQAQASDPRVRAGAIAVLLGGLALAVLLRRRRG